MSSSEQTLIGSVDLWKVFEVYIYKDEAVGICSDTKTFRYLMSYFDSYEFEVSFCSYVHVDYVIYVLFLIKSKLQGEGPGKQSESLLKKLLKHVEEIKSKPAGFDENFPFYALLAVRMHR